MTIKKAYYYLYYKLYKFAISISDDFLNEWKPLLTILILEVLLLIEALIWYSVIAKTIVVVNNPLVTFFPVVSLIGIGNYYFFLHKDKWKSYVKEFKSYSKKKQTIGGVIVFAIIVFIVITVVIAFYCLSQIDWRLYR